jgi:hypothetical protein
VASNAKRPAGSGKPQGKRYGLGIILLTIAVSTGICAALGVLMAHLFH